MASVPAEQVRVPVMVWFDEIIRFATPTLVLPVMVTLLNVLGPLILGVTNAVEV